MKLIIFDCDGTIVDSQHAIVAAMNEGFAAHGFDAPKRQDVLGVVGLSLVEAVDRLLPDEHRLEAAVPVAESYKVAFAALRRQPGHNEPLFQGALETISELRARDDVLLGIATGKSRRGVDALFEREGLHDHFATIQTADDHPSKPHPSMIEQAMMDCGVEADQTVMIGDTTFDMDMARAAGVPALGVTWGYHPREFLLEAGADELVDEYEHVPAALWRLLKVDGGQ
ncbi:MAG: HAD-IA family hydrolase [Filomicrobium sp.]